MCSEGTGEVDANDLGGPVAGEGGRHESLARLELLSYF